MALITIKSSSTPSGSPCCQLPAPVSGVLLHLGQGSVRLKSALQIFNIPLISEERQFWRMQPNAMVLGTWSQVLRAAFDGRKQISVRGPVSFLPVAGGQVLSRAFLPQG